MIIPSGYGQVSIFYGGVGVPRGAANTWGFQNVVGASAASCVGAVNSVLNLIDWKALYCGDCTTELIRVKLGPNSTGPMSESAATYGGTRAGNCGASATSLLVRKSTPLGGRKQQGRMFIPGQSESDVSPGGAVASGLITAGDAILGDLLNGLDGEGLPMVLLHTDATNPTAVTSLSIQPYVANQRRRQRRS